MRPVVEADVRHVLSRQGEGLKGGEREALATEINRYLEACWQPPKSSGGIAGAQAQKAETTLRPQDFINLFLVETFINRHHGEN
jgi:hypothetical protein